MKRVKAGARRLLQGPDPLSWRPLRRRRCRPDGTFGPQLLFVCARGISGVPTIAAPHCSARLGGRGKSSDFTDAVREPSLPSIEAIHARQILDSRGNPTVEVE